MLGCWGGAAVIGVAALSAGWVGPGGSADPGDGTARPLPAGTTAPDLEGQPIRLDAPDGGVAVLAFLWSECPISNQYGPVLGALASRWGGRPVAMIGLYVDPDRPAEELAGHARDHGLGFPVGRDESTRLARAMGVEKVPAVVVIDDRGRVRYRGRIDDRFYALGRKRSGPIRPDLEQAVQAILAGREAEPRTTEVVGCTLPTPPEGVGAGR